MSDENVFSIVVDEKSISFDLRNKTDYIQKEIFSSKKFYELDVLEELGTFPLGDGVICDVGANIGNHSLYFAIVLGRHVFAFEPLREAFEMLERNVRINRCQGSVTTLNVALGSAGGLGSMIIDEKNLGASRFVRSSYGETVLTTLDSSLPEGSIVAAIKIDVEGFEQEVLLGALATIERCKPLLIVEAVDHYAYLKVARTVERIGYLPIGKKGKTPTYFFVHNTRWSEASDLGTFLIRSDIDRSSRRLHGQLDRMAKSVGELPAREELGSLAERLAAPLQDLSEQLATQSGVTREHTAKTSNELAARLLSSLREHTGEQNAALAALLEAHTRANTEQSATSQRALTDQIADLTRSVGELPAREELGSLAERLAAPLQDLSEQLATQSGVTREHTAKTSNELAARLLSSLREHTGEQNAALAALLEAQSHASTEQRQSVRRALERHLESLLANRAVNQRQELSAQLSDASSRICSRIIDSSKEQSAQLARVVETRLIHQHRSVQEVLRPLADRDDKLSEAKEKISALEGEIARLLVDLQTERVRTQYVSRRLHTLYTSGARPFADKLRKFLNAVSLGRVKQYETWSEFERRRDVRVRREIDDFKKMHAQVADRARNKNTTPARRLVRDVSPSEVAPIRAFPTVHAKPAARVAAGIDRVRVGIASIEVRRTALSRTIDSLYDQADELVIYLNDYAEIPEYLNREKIRVIHGKGDVGDRGKFYDVENFNGYIFACDDDILYPPYYIKHCIDAIERYGRKAVVGWHGSVFKAPFEDYYSPDSRRVYSFRSGRPADIAVHVLGTGCTAFHSSTIRVQFADFKTSNMADVYFALLGQQQQAPFVVIKHDPAEALPLDIPDDKPIHRESMSKTGSKADTKELQNKLVKEWRNWRASMPPVSYERELCTIAYVGRLDKERWKKGGILKSGHLILESLRALGHRVLPLEISEPLESLVSSIKDASIVWIYPGDPERPDFAPVESLIDAAAAAGKQVYVNLSYNLKQPRNQWLLATLSKWAKQYGTRVKACMFTHAGTEDPALHGVRSNLVCIPKTIDFPESYSADFSATSGIFLGDLQKLLNRDLVAGNIEDWISALREALPDVPLYAVRQYGGKIDRDLGLSVLPFTQGEEWHDWLSKRRLACCLTPHATFEMIPLEAAGVGVPIVYRPMPQSLSEALASAGLRVETPDTFARACSMLYRDPMIWRMYSEGSKLRAKSQHIGFAAAAIHAHLTLGRH